MATLQKILPSWHKLILQGEVETVHEQLKAEIARKKWTMEQENQMANYCLVAINTKAYELMKSDVKDPLFAEQIFIITNFCLRAIEKTWKCKAKEFLGSLNVICRYFLTLGNTYEALVIGQYCMEFVDKCHSGKLSEDENTTVKGILSVFLNHLNKISVDNLETTLEVWKFILSPQGLEAKNSNFASILTVFAMFCGKANSPESLQTSLRILSYLSRMPCTCLADKDIDTYMSACEIIIRYSKADQLKSNIESVICCIERIKSLCSSDQLLVIEFCLNILRFSICSCDLSSCSMLVHKCIVGLKSINLIVPILRNRAVNFARVELIQTHNCWMNGENFFYRKCFPDLFVFFTTLAKAMKCIEMNPNGNTCEMKYSTVIGLALLIFQRIQDLSTVELRTIYSYVKKCLNMLLEIYEDSCEMDNAQKINLFNKIGAHSFNVCCFYMKAKLYSECEELSLMASERIASLPNDLIQNSSLEPFIEKISICLYQSYMYESALKIMCIWAVKLPHYRNVFMNRFASFKDKLFCEKQDCYTESLNKTCWDLIKDDQQKNPAFWEKINFTDRDVLIILKQELKLYLTHQIHSVDLIEKIIDQSAQQKDDVKIELYILAGLIFTQSGDMVGNALKLLPPIDEFIEELNQKMKKSISKENVIQYSSILGTLQYVKFRIKLLNARCENEKEVALTKSINKPKTIPSEPGTEQEIRDDSDVIHKNLTYKSQQEFIYFLDSAVDCWSQAISEATDGTDLKLREKCSKICTELDIQTLIHETALMYRLYFAESKEIRAWRLLNSLAVIREDEEMVVCAFSNLVSLNAQVDPEHETEVQQKLTNVEKITQIRYRLETIRKLFINGRGVEGVTILSQISEDDVKSNVILEAKYHFLASQYTLAGFYKVSDYAMSTAIRAFYLLVPCIKKNSWRNLWEACEIQSLLLDVTLFILHFHTAAFQTNFLRTYLDKAVYLIKKLGLPLRICQFLTTACRIGVITCKTEDVYVKLDSLKTVLKFNDGVKEENYDKPPPAKTVATLSPDFSSNTDVRFVSNFESNYASPILDSGLKYSMPEFVDHKLNCECVICDDVLYQQISCEVMSLFGSYFWLLGSNHHGQALHHFEDALEMSSQLENRWKSRNPIKCEIFSKSVVAAKMCLSDFWASAGDFEKSRNLNKEALVDYENLIIPNGALRTQLNDQYFALERIKLSADLPKKKSARQKLTLNTNIAKTPACKRTVTVFEDDKATSRITEALKNMTVTPLPKATRRLLSFKTDDDNLKPSGSSRTTRVKGKKEETPPDIVMQTPSALRFSSRKGLENKAPSSALFKIDDDFFATPKPTASSRTTRIRNKKEETPLDIVLQTPSSLGARSRKVQQNKATSAALPANDDDLFTTPMHPASSRIARIKNKEETPLDKDAPIPSFPRISSRKKIPDKVTSSIAIKNDESEKLAEPKRVTKTRNKDEKSADIVTRTPSSRTRSKKLLETEKPSCNIFKKDEDLVASVSKSVLPIRTSKTKSKTEENTRLDRANRSDNKAEPSVESNLGLRIRKN